MENNQKVVKGPQRYFENGEAFDSKKQHISDNGHNMYHCLEFF